LCEAVDKLASTIFALIILLAVVNVTIFRNRSRGISPMKTIYCNDKFR
jgi:hypothetical protein